MQNHPEWQELFLDNEENLTDYYFLSLLELDLK